MDPRRRGLLAGLGGLAAGLLPGGVSAAALRRRSRIVVVGGGFAGATCAGVLRQLLPRAAITLIEPRAAWVTGPLSNAMLVGMTSRSVVTHGPAALARRGIRVEAQSAVAIDVEQRRVRTSDRRWHAADRIVVAPGIDPRWGFIEGLDADSSDAMPHGWTGGHQLDLLERRLSVLEDGATVVIAAPQNPYRCPPGPYERASLFAWYLSRRRQRCKILVVDAKDDFSKRALFQLGWDQLYPGVIEWVPRASGGEVVSVDVAAASLVLASGERIRADLASVIPLQQAGALARSAGLADSSGWCPVDPASFRSTLHEGIHVIGDAAIAQPMPKSAFSANSQAKLCALAIAAELTGQPAPEARLLNTCYSLLAPDHAISVSGVYGVAAGRLGVLNEGVSELVASPGLRATEATNARAWYGSIIADSFGG